MMKHLEKCMRAFTLVETMVAITVLSMAMLAPFYAAHEALTASEVARDRLTASMLAEEGIEYVRQIRDDNFLEANQSGTPNTDWLNGLDGGPNCFTHQCRIDATIPAPNGVVECSIDGCTVPMYINAQYEYTQTASGNTKTIFTRHIQLTTISATEVELTSTVTWTDHAPNSSASSLTLTEYLTNWQ